MPIGPFRRRDPIRVQPFYGFRNAERLTLNARALRSQLASFEKRSFLRDVATMAGQYMSREVAGLKVELEYELTEGSRVTAQVISDIEGYAQFDVALPDGAAMPEEVCWDKATVRWISEEGEEHQAIAYILVPGMKTELGLISDIDDTIMETGITGSFRMIARNWKRVLRQMPSERVVVPGAAEFYEALGGSAEADQSAADTGTAIEPRARKRPVFYVSSSPWNLFSYLVTFKRSRGIPLGPVALRDWGFNRKTLGSEGHGSHKRDAIESILAAFPHMKFALIGDDTQKDLVAFGAIARDHPDRIAAVFIRRISEEPLNADENAAQAAIEAVDVPFWNGKDYLEAKEFLQSAGLELDASGEKLLRTAAEDDAPLPGAGPAEGN